MEKLYRRLPFAIGIFISIIALVIGSFYDLEFSKMIANTNSIFGIIMGAFSNFLGYCLSTLFLGFAAPPLYKKCTKTWQKVFVSIVLVGSLFVIVFFSGGDIFSDDGFNIRGIGFRILGIAISLLINGIVFYFGLKIGKKNINNDNWIGAVIYIICMLIFLLMVLGLLKLIFYRPRFRALNEDIHFINWWQIFPSSKKYTSINMFNSFSSFPSGHAIISSVLVSGFYFLGLYNPFIKKHNMLFMFIGLFLSIIISFSRICAGAHFISDVAFGTLFSLILGITSVEIYCNKFKDRSSFTEKTNKVE